MTKLGSNKGRNNPKLYEDSFEALIGAILSDFGEVQGERYAKRFIIGKVINTLMLKFMFFRNY